MVTKIILTENIAPKKGLIAKLKYQYCPVEEEKC